MTEPKLVLSVQQPFTWLIVNGYKDIENRDWPTKVRGPVFMHAGKRFDAAAYHALRAAFPSIPFPGIAHFALGGIVGRATIHDCVTASSSPWFKGRYGFVLTDQKPLPFVPLRGQLGFFPAPRSAGSGTATPEEDAKP